MNIETKAAFRLEKSDLPDLFYVVRNSDEKTQAIQRSTFDIEVVLAAARELGYKPGDTITLPMSAEPAKE